MKLILPLFLVIAHLISAFAISAPVHFVTRPARLKVFDTVATKKKDNEYLAVYQAFLQMEYSNDDVLLNKGRVIVEFVQLNAMDSLFCHIHISSGNLRQATITIRPIVPGGGVESRARDEVIRNGQRCIDFFQESPVHTNILTTKVYETDIQ